MRRNKKRQKLVFSMGKGKTEVVAHDVDLVCSYRWLPMRASCEDLDDLIRNAMVDWATNHPGQSFNQLILLYEDGMVCGVSFISQYQCL